MATIFPEIDRAGQQQAITIPLRLGRSDRPPLNGEQRRDLYQFVQMPGWGVLLKMMEDVCIQQETDLVNLDTADKAGVEAQHAITKAMWLFFTRVQKKVVFEVNELFASVTGPAPDREQLEVAAILDATQAELEPEME